MNCGSCKNSYNVKDHYPYLLVDCGHTVCLKCLKNFNEKTCPKCQVTISREAIKNKDLINESYNSLSYEITFKEKFKAINELGSGRYGPVFRVKNIQDQKEYAIKVIETIKYNKEERSNYKNESDILIRLDNEYIIKCYEQFFDKTSFCIVTEYCQGGDLENKIKEKIKEKTVFMQIEIYKWTKQIILGIDYLHDNKIIHRDIKPSNIFLTKEENVKIGDMDISRSFNLKSTQETSKYAGTLAYMSPEILDGKPYSFETDIWSFGCVLFELVTLEKYAEKKRRECKNCQKIFKNIINLTIREQQYRKNSKEIIKLIKENPFMNLLTTLRGHSDYILCLAVLKNGYLCSGSDDKTIKIWNGIEGKLIDTLTEEFNSVECLTVLKNGYLCSGSDDHTIKIWDPLEKKLIHTLIGHSGSVKCLTTLKNGYLCSGSLDDTIKIWCPLELKLIHTLKGHCKYVLCLAVLRNGYLCSGSLDRTIKIWNAIEGNLIYTLKGHSDSVNCLTVLKNGYLCSGSRDNTIKIWDTMEKEMIKTLIGHSNSVDCLIVLNNGYLCSGSDDNTIKIWDPFKGTLINTLIGHNCSVWCLTVLNNGYLCSGSGDKTIKIWDSIE